MELCVEMLQSVLLLLVPLYEAGLVVEAGVLAAVVQEVAGAPAPPLHPPRGQRGQTGQTDAAELFPLPPDGLPDEVTPLPEVQQCQDRLWRMSGCLSPDGGNSPEVVPAYTPGVNGESEVAAPLHETHVRDEDQVDGRDGLTDL